LTTGFIALTSRLNMLVAASVAPTLITLVTAAALTISAFGTGTRSDVPGTVNVVVSAEGSGLEGISRLGTTSGCWLFISRNTSSLDMGGLSSRSSTSARTGPKLPCSGGASSGTTG